MWCLIGSSTDIPSIFDIALYLLGKDAVKGFILQDLGIEVMFADWHDQNVR
jgi:hypothetical protein